ncbi:MAG: flavin monoamine oxidase family protein [Rubrobacteraceae bacterium]
MEFGFGGRAGHARRSLVVDVPVGSAADVLVVGAGLAGLYAARLLRRAGLGVAVLEARDRVGGRVLSRRLEDGSSVDLGAQWIGPGQRRMYALAQEYDLATTRTHSRGDATIEVDGRLQRVPSGSIPLSWPGRLDSLQLGWKISRIASKLSVTEPWRHPRAARLDLISFAHWLKENTFSREARSYWAYVVESGMCASPDDFSPLELAQQVATIGGLRPLETAEHEFFEAGSQAIAWHLAAELGDRLHLLTPVRALRRDGPVVRAITARGEFSGRRVILALPTQLVGRISFDETFPPQTRRKQEQLVVGRVVKNIVVYERAWWRGEGLSGTADTPKGPVNSLADTSSVSGRPGILVALATGPHAVTLGQMDHETRKATVLDHVRRTLGAAPAPPTDFLSMDWTAEPWSLGGYASRRAIGGWTRHNSPDTPRGPVHFAGTETATEWRSYMEGALQSAERASAEVISGIE